MEKVFFASKQKKFLNYIQYFRAVSIVFIVLGHCFDLRSFNFIEGSSFLTFIRAIATGGSAFFVFISGYLFHHNHSYKFQLLPFLIKKFKYLVLPFLLFTSLDFLYYLVRNLMNYYLYTKDNNTYLKKLQAFDFLERYLFGYSEIAIGLWYIPFILVLYSLSHLFDKFRFLNIKIQIYSIISLLIISSILHRTNDYNFKGLIQNVIYFTPVYLLGVFTSENKTLLICTLSNYRFHLLIISLIIAIFQINSTELNSFIDLMIFQKVFLTLFLFLFFLSLKKPLSNIFTLLADNSFGIFFIHGIFIWFINAILNYLNLKFSFGFFGDLFLYISLSFFILFLSLMITISIKWLLPNKSKFFIGC